MRDLNRNKPSFGEGGLTVRLGRVRFNLIRHFASLVAPSRREGNNKEEIFRQAQNDIIILKMTVIKKYSA